MYSVLFHVSGIAILEICFYFFYIGPMETVIFTDKVRRLVNEPLELLNTDYYILPTPPSSNDNDLYNDYPIGTIIETIIVENNNNTNNIMNDLEQQRDNAIDKRNEKNDALFIKTLEYWMVMAFSCVLIYILVKNYKEYYKLKKTNGVTQVNQTISDEESLELVEINATYRRGSIDDEHLETNDNNTKHSKTCNKVGKQVLHYIMFGGGLLCFQYFFFQNVVLVYDPLSIQEVKYIIYSKLYPEIDMITNGTTTN